MIVRRMGEAYSSGDCTVVIAGVFDINPTAIEYDSKHAHTAYHGIRRRLRTWGMGKEELTAKITLPIDVVAEFEKVAPHGKIAFLRPFPINVVFLNLENEMIQDYLYVKFTGNGRSVTVDGELVKELELFPLDIQFNVK